MNTDKFRALLIAEQDETVKLMSTLGADISSLVAARQDSNNDDEHDPEGSTLAFERSQTDALLAQSTQRLAEVAAALERLDAGTYGICVRCGGPIARARLAARPYAPTCITCAAL
ncbi:MAG TPA: TraR/DksA family transcriptional regulator [Homoserinimonas sp.]|nr:TraR/DksA family transcriptional regulator [Homoserinimonas sp.]